MAAEQFLAFEEEVIYPAVAHLRRNAAHSQDHDFMWRIGRMMVEEREHARMFLGLLRSAMPSIYAHRDRHFTRLRPLERLVCAVCARTPPGNLVLMWLALVIEEHSVTLSKAMLVPVSGGLGVLDTDFVEVHRRHLLDEVRHLPLDELLIQRSFDRQPLWLRRLLARLFVAVLRDIATPKRAARRVISHLIHEFPDLAPRRKQLLRCTLQGRRAAPDCDIADLERHPRTARALSARSEFADLLHTIAPGGSSPAFEPLSHRTGRIAAILVLSPLASLGYWAVGAAVSSRTHPTGLLETALDRALPLMPPAILVYASLGAFLLVAAWGSSAKSCRRLIQASLTAMALSYACFIVWPVAVDRGGLPGTEPWHSLFAAVREMDPPHNSFPSLHVAYVTVALASKRWPWWVWAWGLSIIASTVLTRQHVVLDVAAGVALGVAAWLLAGRWPWSGRDREIRG
ncbi:MAG: phosphatase PAP2 family protein [Planctomycetes bacterium]|nr:phosphatase PAP2 family protein [Planctomycetota bacterium]